MRRYKDNPFIEKIPSVFTLDEFNQNVRVYPETDFGGISKDERFQCVNDVMQYYEPLTRSFRLYRQLINVVLEGYHIRTPEKIKELYKNRKNGLFTSVYNDLEGHIEGVSHILNFSLFGDPGTGKSKCLEKIRSLFPPSIFHKELQMTQVPIVYFECPDKASPKQLLQFFLIKLDTILKTKSEFDSKGLNPVELLDFVRKKCIEHMVGVIIIDEVHNLKTNTEKEIESVVKFLKTFSNVVKTPIVYVGTFEAEEVLFRNFQSSIRMQGVGSFRWKRYNKVDDEIEYEDWEFFLESLWEFQVLKRPGKLTSEIKDSYKRKCQGTIRLASVLHMIAQQVALSMQKETITVDILDLAEQDRMFATEKIALGLENEDYDSLKPVGDINPVRNAVYEVLSDQEQSLIRSPEFHEAKKMVKKVFPKLLDEFVDECVVVVLKEYPDLKLKAKMKKIQEVIQELCGNKKVKSKKTKLIAKGDLVELVKNYSDADQRYNILEESGIIQSPLEILKLG